MGRKTVDETNNKTSYVLLFVYSKHETRHSEVGLGGNVCNWQGQAALTAVTEEYVWFIIVYCFFTVVV